MNLGSATDTNSLSENGHPETRFGGFSFCGILSPSSEGSTMAGNTIEFKFTGTEQIVAKFKQLSESARREIATPAAKDAMEIVLNDATDRAYRLDDPSTAKTVAKNVTMIERKAVGRETGTVIFSVGVRTKGRLPGRNTWNWWYLEMGTEHARAHPFLRPALWNNRVEVFQEFISSAKYQLVRLGIS